MDDAIRDWHDFYSVAGAAAATLTGLLFVAISVGSSFFTPERDAALRAFVSPSLVHFATVLMLCLIALAPLHRWGLGALLVGGAGLFGVGYTGAIFHAMYRQGHAKRIQLDDRIWYMVAPVLAHALNVAAGVALLMHAALGYAIVAFSTAALLVIGIRNAWDMATWTVVNRRD